MKMRLLGCLFVVLALPLAAQVNNASLSGLITDPSDSSAAGVKVTAHSQSINLQRSTVSDSSGYYYFPSLPVGTYEVTVQGTGFQEINQQVTLETAQKGRLDFKLSVTQLQTAVTVNAVALQLAS